MVDRTPSTEAVPSVEAVEELAKFYDVPTGRGCLVGSFTMQRTAAILRALSGLRSAPEPSADHIADAGKMVAGEPSVEPVVASDHPDFIGGIVWSPLELRWINQKLAEARRAPEPGAERIPSVLFDGYEVYTALDDKARTRTSGENVTDVLDAVVRILRKQPATKEEKHV